MSPKQSNGLFRVQKYSLLTIFCFVQFLDAFNFSALFSALPHIQEDLNMDSGETSWIISAFQLTFASFLLLSGRLSDVTNPKYTFVLSTVGIGCLSIATGFLKDKIVFIVFRALAGVMGAMTIPSALTLLVNIFPDPREQAQAIGTFGGSGGVGNVLGLLIGAIFTKLASWRWIFWFIAIIAFPTAILSAILVPPQTHPADASSQPPLLHKLNSLDLGGLTLLTASVILFIYALTEGSAGTWVTVKVLLPLVLSVGLMVAFFLWEKMVPEYIAAIPPRTWFYQNFAVLFAVSLLPYLWFTTMFDVNMILWQDVYRWNSLDCAVRMIPSGIVTFSMALTGPLARRISPKWIILFGMVCMLGANILFAYADGPNKYWPFAFPAIIIGDAGAMLAYTHANIAIFETTPSNMAGTVGAIFNGALQLGSAVGIAAITSIETSVEATHGGSTGYAGRSAAWWFLVGVVALEALAVAVFYRTTSPVVDESELPLSGTTTAVATPANEKTEAELGFAPLISQAGDAKDAAASGASVLQAPLPARPPRIPFTRTTSDATLAISILGKKECDSMQGVAASIV